MFCLFPESSSTAQMARWQTQLLELDINMPTFPGKDFIIKATKEWILNMTGHQKIVSISSCLSELE